MSNHSFKKISAAAVVAVLGMGAASHAAIIYTTGFEPTAFTPGALVGQGGFTDFNGGGTGTGTVTLTSAQSGLQGVEVNSNASNQNSFTEFLNPATAVSPAQLSGGTATVSFGLERVAPTGGQTTGSQPVGQGGPAEAGFGVEVLNNTQDAVIASVFVRNTSYIPPGGPAPSQPSVPALFMQDSASPNSPNDENFAASGAAALDGNYGSYTLALNFFTDTFTVTGPNGTSTSVGFASTYNGQGIGGVLISADNEGNDTAYFDNFTVAAEAVPEPVSMGLLATGGLMLMGRRRRVAAI